jgi:hypothetical protein
LPVVAVTMSTMRCTVPFLAGDVEVYNPALPLRPSWVKTQIPWIEQRRVGVRFSSLEASLWDMVVVVEQCGARGYCWRYFC